MSDSTRLRTTIRGKHVVAESSHVDKLKAGVAIWNLWRPTQPSFSPILTKSSFAGMNLREAALSNADFGRSDLSGVDFTDADLYQAEFYRCDLRGANLSRCDLRGAKFHDADLSGANLSEAHLYRADFIGTRFDEAIFNRAICAQTAFSDVDLSYVHGLDEVTHLGPSSIDIATLLLLKPPYPEQFLLGAGIPESSLSDLLKVASHASTTSAYSCFISYSHNDEEFATALYRRLKKERIRVWYAPEEMKGGQKLHEQIDNAIGQHDRLLIVLSQDSMNSHWVEAELRKARLREVTEKRKVLFPIRLCDFTEIESWELFDSSSGNDLAAEVRSYYIPDFSNWRNRNKFKQTVDRLIEALTRPNMG